MNKEQIKKIIGEDAYLHLEKEANAEVGLALEMSLVDQYRQEKWYHQRYLVPELLTEFELFEEKGLKFSPVDVVNVLFRCKLAFAVGTEADYFRRIPGGSYVNEYDFMIKWSEKSKGIDGVIDQYLERMQTFVCEQTLLTPLSHFEYASANPDKSPTVFFEELFKKLSAPFSIYFDDNLLVDKYKIAKPGLPVYTAPDARRYFHVPSLGFTASGSSMYAYLYASTWSRTFLNLLRIAGFIYRPQIDFGTPGIEIIAPTGSAFLGSNSYGVYSWNEDAKAPWEKIPDGCLFLSFGYRGISKLWLDERAYGGIEKFMLENKVIFDYLKNPWRKENREDISSALDILSSATQTQDLGAKILLIYCCLEHLFVPKNTNSDNKKYIVGGIHAIAPDLLPWFNQLYRVRCAYAHRGYVLKTNEVVNLVFDSVKSVLALLVLKLV